MTLLSSLSSPNMALSVFYLSVATVESTVARSTFLASEIPSPSPSQEQAKPAWTEKFTCKFVNFLAIIHLFQLEHRNAIVPIWTEGCNGAGHCLGITLASWPGLAWKIPSQKPKPAQATARAWLGLVEPWLGWPGFWIEAQASTTLEAVKLAPVSSVSAADVSAELQGGGLLSVRLNFDANIHPAGTNEIARGSLAQKLEDFQSSGFVMPEVTPDGQIYYVNTRTGQRARDLPDEGDGDSFDNDKLLRRTVTSEP
ncbi:hypothetical protein B0H13DRAFT_1932387 [Mycena leptocephala]|nr:hypothetical protein B0H13DRAFT_1932387 [Mycena leptocephala]